MLDPIPRSSLSDAVFVQLRDRIVQGALSPGEPLPAERALCEALGVNRGAVREALRRLEQARLISVRHGGTSRVLDYRERAGLDLLPALLVGADGTIDTAVVRGIVEMRSALAPDAARLAALRGGAPVAEALTAEVDAMSGTDDLEALQGLAVRYWTAVVAGSQNLAYRLAWNSLHDVYSRALPLVRPVIEEELRDAEGYGRLAAAIGASNAPLAETEARALVGRGERALLTALAALEHQQEDAR